MLDLVPKYFFSKDWKFIDSEKAEKVNVFLFFWLKDY